MKSAKFNTISQWINAGALNTGLMLVSTIAKESDKAIGIADQRYNQYGNAVPAICWFPKSQIQAVENDYYTDGSTQNYLVPAWLVDAKKRDGFCLI
jgi:hypothetical protein